MMKIEGSGSGSISQRHGSVDPDPDPHQNVMDPQHCSTDDKNHLSISQQMRKLTLTVTDEKTLH
jgi:hypothetical protein